MSESVSTLDLVERLRPGIDLAESSYVEAAFQTRRVFLDFVVEGASLLDRIASKYDLASVLWIDPPALLARSKAARRLLLLDPGDLPNGRVSIYTCPECGDLGCGGITANIELLNNHFVWHTFGFQNNYDGHIDTESFSSFGPFKFDIGNYEACLKRLLLPQATSEG